MPSPSFGHEAPLHLLRDSPTLILTLLRDLLGISIPRDPVVAVEEADLTQLLPIELRADLVLTLKGRNRRLGVVVEHQMRWDARKRYAWPLYAAAAHAKLRCPIALVVLAATEGVAERARDPICDVQVGSAFFPLVIGPGRIPRVTKIEEAIAAPELAVLSALTHGRTPVATAIGWAAIEGIRVAEAAGRLDQEHAQVYLDVVFAAVGEVARQVLETMLMQKYEYQSEFVQRLLSKGKAEGKAEGIAQGEARAILEVLQTRGLGITEAHRERILACADLTVLQQWIRRAVTATSVDEVLADG